MLIENSEFRTAHKKCNSEKSEASSVTHHLEHARPRVQIRSRLGETSMKSVVNLEENFTVFTFIP